MDSLFAHDNKARKRSRSRRMCSLCNESCRDPDEEFKHYSGAVHKHMKRIKQKQYAYTKDLRTLDEKIKAAVEQNEPLIGLEYIHQYAADRTGVIPYVCMLCDRVYKLDTIFFHIVGFKHRCLYLSKHFPALGIDIHFKARTHADCVKLLNASEVIEKCHGRQKINVSSALFNPKKNGMEYDSDSGREGLSSSEDERNDGAVTKLDWETLRSGAGDHNNRSATHRGDLTFQHDWKSGPPLSNVDRGGPALKYDDRREVQDGRRDANRPQKDRGFQQDYSDRNFQEDGSRLPMELSYQQRSVDGRKVPGREDFSSGPYLSSQMHRDGTAFHGDDLKGGPRQADNQVRNPDRDFNYQHDQYKRSQGGDPIVPSMGALPQQVERDGVRSQNLQSQKSGTAFQYDGRQTSILGAPPPGLMPLVAGLDDFKSQNRTQSLPSGSYGDLQSQVNRVGMGYPNEVRNLNMPSLGPLHHQDRDLGHRDGVLGLNRTQNLTTKFPSDLKTGLEMDRDRDGMAYRYGARNDDHDQNTDDAKFHNRTQNRTSDFVGDQFQSRVPRGEMGFQSNDRHGPILPEGLGHTGKQVRENDFASQNEQRTLLGDGPHGGYTRVPLEPLRADREDFQSKDRLKSHPPGFRGDPSLGTRDETSLQYDDRRGPKSQADSRHNKDHLKNDRMQRDGMAFQYDNREGPRAAEKQVRNNDRDFSFGHDQRRLGNAHGDLGRPLLDDAVRGFPSDRPNVHGDLDVPSKKPFYRQGDREIEERSGLLNSRPGLSDDRSLFSQTSRGGTARDGRSGGGGTRFQMRGEFLSFRELKAAHKAGVPIGPGGMDEKDLRNCDPDQFLSNTEVLEFVGAFKIQSPEDEQFASRVRDLLTNSSTRYRKKKEESLKRRIAQEKETLEEEKKAFLEIQRAKEGLKKKHPQPSTTALSKTPVPGSSSTSIFPVTSTSNTGPANKPIPLMSLVIGRHKEAESNPQQSLSYQSLKGSMAESRPRTMNMPTERRSRWAPEPTKTQPEMRLDERSNPPSERRDFFDSRRRDEGARNLPSRFSSHTSSMKY